MQKRTAGPYGQRTKITYRRSIAQYIVFVKNLETIYSYAGGNTEKEILFFLNFDCRKGGYTPVFISERIEEEALSAYAP